MFPVRFNRRSALGAALLGLAFSSLAFAQSTNQRLLVTIYNVKPEMSQEFRDIMKNDIGPIFKKAGRTRAVFRTAPFNGSPYEYMVSAPIDNYSQFDGENWFIAAAGRETYARIGAKLTKCVYGTQRFISTARPDLSNPLPSGAPPKKVLVQSVYRVNPGQSDAYETFLKTEIQPLYKKNNVTYGVNQRGFGSPAGTWVTNVSYDKYADLEGGSVLVKLLGREGAAKIMAKSQSMRSLVSTVVRTYDEELSITK